MKVSISMANSPKIGFTVLEYGGKKSTIGFPIFPITAVNLPDFLTDVGTVRGAIEGVMLGTIESERAQVFNTKISAIAPSNKGAQRELKWYVRGYDERQFLDVANTIPNPNYQDIFGFEVPCADESLLATGSDYADPTNAAVATFVTEVEKIWRSDSDGQMRVIDMRLVGRSF